MRLTHPVRRCPRNGKRDKPGIGHCAAHREMQAWEGARRERLLASPFRPRARRPALESLVAMRRALRDVAHAFAHRPSVPFPSVLQPPFNLGRAGVRAGEPTCNRATSAFASPHSPRRSRCRPSPSRKATMRRISTTWWSPPPAPPSPPTPPWPRSRSSTARTLNKAPRVRCRNCCAAAPASPWSTRAGWASSAPCSCAAPNPTTPCSWSMACAWAMRPRGWPRCRTSRWNSSNASRSCAARVHRCTARTRSAA